MKIAMVSEDASPLAEGSSAEASGRGLHVAGLSAAFTRRGHEVTVYTRRTTAGTPAELVADGGYRVVSVPAGPPTRLPGDRTLPHLGEFGTFLQRHWAAEQPDIVHAHHWLSGLAAELAARAHGIPVVLTFHGLGAVQRRCEGLADPSPRSRIRFERLIAIRAAHVVASCHEEAVELTRMGVPRFRTSIVPGGVDLTVFAPVGICAERHARHRLVAAGELVRRNGFDAVVKALPELPDAELVIAGGPTADDEDNSEGRRLRHIAAEYGVRERLRLLGPVARPLLPRLYRSADVVVCTPWYEPSGRVAREAMACGRPVVATGVGSLLDAVVDGVTGRLVAPLEPGAIARAVRPLLEDMTLRETWGAAGYQRAADRHCWDRVAVETLDAYHRGAPAHAGEVVSRAR
ncbi:glycosyltransferase [Nocardia sp. R6R-6]|uniref:glycosyltransferase n=1 Tax=Nocardia sp. R6R-6 TaxID=3459303 RepID=UPI00403DBE8C